MSKTIKTPEQELLFGDVVKVKNGQHMGRLGWVHAVEVKGFKRTGRYTIALGDNVFVLFDHSDLRYVG